MSAHADDESNLDKLEIANQAVPVIVDELVAGHGMLLSAVKALDVAVVSALPAVLAGPALKLRAIRNAGRDFVAGVLVARIDRLVAGVAHGRGGHSGIPSSTMYVMQKEPKPIRTSERKKSEVMPGSQCCDRAGSGGGG